MEIRRGRRPADNNVQDVLSTIDNYQSGAVRALAQDPPQNSSDAQRNGVPVQVKYALHFRVDASEREVVLLTITDSGTTGLDGLMLTLAELEKRERAEGQLVIEQGENWAAWEAMRYTKAGEDKLGSRGQGKYAYLYHSAHPGPGNDDDPDAEPKNNWRMVILYDTLLPSGEYRLGVRYHNPATQVIEPPYSDEEAHQVLREGYEDEAFLIPLGLEPLREVGSRIIIPFLSLEAREAFASNELHRWLRLGWWRQIQKGRLSISVDSGDGLVEEIGVPGHWSEMPWVRDEVSYFVREHVPLPDNGEGDNWNIKRLVLFHDDALRSEDHPGNPQEVGIQMLRGGQWITTIGASELSDYIPREYREGFRGFVEFDTSVEAALREIENPAHDGFNKRKWLFQDIGQTIRQLVEEFALERGWIDEDDQEPASSYDDLVREVAEMFVEPEPGPVPGEVKWSCRVSIGMLGSSRRVAWGESIHVSAECRRAPVADGGSVQFSAVLIGPDGVERPVFDDRGQRLSSRPGREFSSAGCDFGQLEVVHPGGGHPNLFGCAGRHVIAVVCTVAGKEVAKGRGVFYVEAEPPPPPRHPVALEIHARNGDQRSERFQDGDALSVNVTVRNYVTDRQVGELNIAVQERPYVLLREPVNIPCAVSEGQPESLVRSTTERIVRETDQGESVSIVLPQGSYEIRASFERPGEPPVSASVVIFVGDDNDEDDEGRLLPFEFVSDNSPDAPRWIYTPRAGAKARATLAWSDGNPVFEALAGASSNEYVRSIIIEGLIEWAIRDYEDRGDEGGLRLVADGIRRTAPELLGAMEDGIERLMGSVGASPDSRDVFEYGNAQRRLAAVMAHAMRQAS